MQVTVRCFAQVRERVGGDRFVIELGDASTLADVVRAVASRSDTARDLVAWMDDGHLKLARNLTYAPPETVLADGDEVALFPPVTGG